MSGDARPERGASLRTRGSGSVTLLALVLLGLLAARGQPAASGALRPPQPDAPNAIAVCVGPDGILRASPASGGCAAGQTLVRLAPSTAEGDFGNPWNPQADGDEPAPASLDLLGRLEARATAIENGPLFEVVDKEGRAIFQIFPDMVRLRSNGGQTFAELRATGSGGFVLARGLDSQEVSLGTSGDAAGLLATERGERRVEFGRQPAGNFSLRILGPTDLAAGVGESRAGTGALVVGDAAGQVRAAMTVVNGKGSVRIQNDAGEAVVALTESESGAGLLVIGDAKSEPMVKFGVTDNRYGAVLAGPVAGFPLVPGSGLPASYFLGCAGGEKCGPGGGSEQR